MTLPTSLLCIREGKNYNSCEVSCWWLLQLDPPSKKELVRLTKGLRRIVSTWHNDDENEPKIIYKLSGLQLSKKYHQAIILIEKNGVVKLLNKKGWHVYKIKIFKGVKN